MLPMRVFWFTVGCIAVALGMIGIALPLLPTVPFLLLAAFAFGKSSKRLEVWLLNHPKLGPPIHDWRANGAIRRRVKWLATASIAATFALSLIFGAPGYVLGIQAGALSLVLLFIWTRPEH